MSRQTAHTALPVGLPGEGRIATATADLQWTGLYKAGAAAALLSAVLIPLQIASFVIWPPPLGEGAAVWFALFEQYPFRGLLGLDLLLMIDYVLLIPIMLAIYVAIRRTDESLMLLGTGLFVISVAIYFASNTAFECSSKTRY